MSAQINARTRAYVQKTRAEIDRLVARGAVMEGNAFSPVLLVKGEPGPAERDGGTLLSGPDGKALRAALLKLGYAPEYWEALATWRADGNPMPAEDLRLAFATLDPDTVILCDEAAANGMREAYADELFALSNPDEALLTPGLVASVSGMRVLNLGGFEAALVDAHQKQVMWAHLKLVPPLGEPY